LDALAVVFSPGGDGGVNPLDLTTKELPRALDRRDAAAAIAVGAEPAATRCGEMVDQGRETVESRNH